MPVRKPKAPPRARTLLEAVELSGREALTAAGDMAADRVRAGMRRPGRAGGRIQARVSRTSRGAAVTVAPARGDFYLRFVEGGTGGFGPRAEKYAATGGRIVPRNAQAFTIGGRQVESVAGQRPQRMFEKARRAAEAPALRLFERGAQAAADRIARTFR